MTLSERDAINRAEGENIMAEKVKKAIQELLVNKQITPEIATLLSSITKA